MSFKSFDQLLDVLRQNTFLFVSDVNAGRCAIERLSEAYKLLESINISVRWCNEPDLSSFYSIDVPAVFVMDSFDSTFFKEISENFRVISPICLITSLKHRVKIPISSVRCLFNLSLRQCHVTTSCFSESTTQHLKSRVLQMGGFYSPKLLSTITHLITEEVHSSKYSVANAHKIPVVLRSWLEEAWERGISDHTFSALDPIFTARHKCPIFMKCNVTITSFEGPERVEIKRLLIENGANFTPNLISFSENPTTHLIAKKPGSDKYRNAPALRVIIVTKNWLIDSIDNGYRLPEEKYHPEHLLDGTLAVLNSSLPRISNRSQKLCMFIETLNLDQGSTYPFLDGCKIFLCGFSDGHVCKIKLLINMCSGTRFNILNSSVTHVVCGYPNEKEIEEIHNFSPIPLFVLNYIWLFECWKQKRAVSENEFIINPGEMNIGIKKQKTIRKCSSNSSVDTRLMDEYVKEEKILSNLNFQLIDPEFTMLDSIQRMIITNGGNLITDCNLGTPHYIIVPVHFKKRIKYKTHLVTLFWLEESIFFKRLLPHNQHPLFGPAEDLSCQDILSHLTVTLLIGDRYIERSCFIHLLNYMGATHSNHLQKSGNGRTQLIITNNLNQVAIRKAQQWGIPLVSKDWVLECATKKCRMSYKLYSLTDSLQSQNDTLSTHFLSQHQSNINNLSHRFELEEADSYFPQNFAAQNLRKTMSTVVEDGNIQLEELYIDGLVNSVPLKSNTLAETVDVIPLNIEPKRPILRGFKICFGKGFTRKELDQMSTIVDELGGIHTYSYASDITHYINKSITNSFFSEEINLIHREGKLIVGPQWLSDMSKGLLDMGDFSPSISLNTSPCYSQAEKQNLCFKNRKKRQRSTENDPSVNECVAQFPVSLGDQIPKLENVSTQEVFEKFSILCEENGENTSPKYHNSPYNNTLSTFKNNNEFLVPKESRYLSNICFQKESRTIRFSRLRRESSYIGWGPKTETGDISFTTNELSPNSASKNPPSPVNDINTTVTNSSSINSDKKSPMKFTQNFSNNSNSNMSLKKSYSSQAPKYVFLFSRMESEDKHLLMSTILSLGGKFLDSDGYDNACTHLICGNFGFYEKVLCGMAAGIYILNSDYIPACKEEGRFVYEEPFEWGNSLNVKNTTLRPELKNKIYAVSKWRKKIGDRIEKMNQSGSLGRRKVRAGAFDGWIVYSICKNFKRKCCNIETCNRIILAGGGKLIGNLTRPTGIKMALIDGNCKISKNESLLKQLKELEIPVVNHQFIFQFLEKVDESIKTDDFAF